MSNGTVRVVRSLDVYDEQHADPNDDIIPLRPIGTQTTMNNTEPIRPRANNARVIQDPDNPTVWRYVFHPSEMYSKNWLNQHELRYAAFLRATVIDFVRSVAGGLNRRLEDLLETGFEDITRIMRDATSRHELALYGRTTTLVTDFEQDDITDATRRELEDLTQLVRDAGDGVTSLDIARFMHNLTYRNQQHEYAVMRWLTLPYNLRRIYFKPSLKTAVEYALDQVRDFAQIDTSYDVLFSDLLAGDKHTDFVRLVVANMRQIYYEGVRGANRTLGEGAQIQEKLDNIASTFVGYAPEVPPSDSAVLQPAGLNRAVIATITPGSATPARPINAWLSNPI